ncbi:proton-coupled folate transporter-like isoform X1 [Asterias amurensis]|uniref:proton-coupled folate transporter-like isoform X1 n=1 Tax=Asterias amurensis TaxID=7602 RepID=UPI003AB4A01D
MKFADLAQSIMKYLKLITVEPVMFAISVTTFMQQPSNQQLVLQKVCLLNFNKTICNEGVDEFIAVENIVHADAAYWSFYLKIALFLPGALFSSIYGSLSDTVGRKIFLIIPSFGVIFGAVSFSFQALYPHLHLGYLLISEVIVGLSGNVFIAYIVAKCYLCDITDIANRTKRLGVMKSMCYLGGPLGAFLSGILIDKEGFAAVYLIVVAIHIVVIIYVVLLLDETVVCYVIEDDDDIEKSGDSDDDTKKAGCGPCCMTLSRLSSKVLASIEQTVSVCFRARLGFRRKHLLLTQLVGIIHNLCSSAEMDLTVLYTKHTPLNWSATTIGIFISLRTTLKAFTLAVGLPVIFQLVKRHWVQLDLGLVSIGVISTASALVIMAFAKNTTHMMLAPFVGMFIGFPCVILNSIKSKLVEPHEYGSLFASTTLIQTLTSTAGSAVFNSIYAASLPIWPGLSFVVLAGIYFVSLFFLLYLWYDIKVTSSDDTFDSDDGHHEYQQLKHDEEKVNAE